MLERCYVDTRDFRVVPYSGDPPTAFQLQALVQSSACHALSLAIVLLDLPQCDLSGLGLKAAVETWVKLRVDLDSGIRLPSTERFQQLYAWRRNVNLAQAARVPFGNDSQLYAEYSKNLWTALAQSEISLDENLKISINTEERNKTTTTMTPPRTESGVMTTPSISSSRVAMAPTRNASMATRRPPVSASAASSRPPSSATSAGVSVSSSAWVACALLSSAFLISR
ncbi:hypothetical protein PINS_up021046 [Pythium insidiosum]|nr:hypothetical protein PINS_up005722 [Pythium insidiosum]GLE09416.1 hypothetical protein PINS_up021046 [Pythium insidiosum]